MLIISKQVNPSNIHDNHNHNFFCLISKCIHLTVFVHIVSVYLFLLLSNDVLLYFTLSIYIIYILQFTTGAIKTLLDGYICLTENLSIQVCDYDHPSVFDPHFYLNSYPDLEQHGLHTKEAAAQHWCDLGVDEGRQATSTFHTVQYLGTFRCSLQMD